MLNHKPIIYHEPNYVALIGELDASKTNQLLVFVKAVVAANSVKKSLNLVYTG